MYSYRSILIFKPVGEFSPDKLNKLREFLSKLDQITIFSFNQNQVKIEYYPQLYSPEYIEKEISRLGIQIIKDKKKFGFIKRLLGKLAKDNKEEFGNKKLDCCNLNKH